MRLLRIESERFGGIDGRSLGELSPSLTVVLGPNEAGKSSMTTLVRHVLYGFPTQGDKSENPYLSASGAKRQGRLVFADDRGEWVVERVEGVRGGTVTVRALSGRSRDGLLDELTLGVSRAAYRVVFGFGLDEMHQIAQLKGKDDDLLARLYAAGAGLVVSPIDLRTKLVERMENLFKPGGSKPRINEARSQRDGARKEIRRLEAEADGFRADAERLVEVEERLAGARLDRAAAQARAERLGRAVASVERLVDEAASHAAKAAALQREAAEVRATAAAIALDTASLASAGPVAGLVAELPGFRERLDALVEQRSRLEGAELRLRAALDEAGWSEEQALRAAGDAGTSAEIEGFRSELATLRARAGVAAEARDRAEAQQAGAGVVDQTVRPSGSAWAVPGFAVMGLGLAGAAFGLAAGQVPLAVFAGVLAVAGAVLAFLRVPPGRAAGPDPRVRVEVAAATSSAAAAQRAFEERFAVWAERVRAWGLGDGSEDPAAVAARLQAAREARAADRERSAIRDAVARDAERIEAFAARVAAVAALLLGEDAANVSADRCVELVGRAAAVVEAAQQADSVRAAGALEADRLTRESEAFAAASKESADAVAAQLSAVGISDGGMEEVRRLEAAARIDAEDALQTLDSATEEAATLRARIASGAREDDLALLRLKVETLTESIATDASRYVVLALANRLLAMAQERYELERQPEVVKRAEAAFARMTNGRFPRLTVPLGKDAIEVFDESSSAAAPDKLSRGTAEQLYLALRLGLIDQLGDVGAGLPVLMDDILVNFSPDRLRPAATAIVELAEQRQVVFFTCHPGMADLLCEVAPQAARITLDGPRARS
jgi:uncharacterized protein YhaN